MDGDRSRQPANRNS